MEQTGDISEYVHQGRDRVIFTSLLTHSCLIHFLVSHLGVILGQMPNCRKFYISPAVEIFYCMVMFKKHSKCIYSMFKLIQMRVEDNQRWRQIQNPIPPPRWYTPEPMAIHALLEAAYDLKGLRLNVQYVTHLIK